MNHAPDAAFDDGVLPAAAALLAGLVARRLERAATDGTAVSWSSSRS
jgi:hypothetical protein